MFMPYNLQAITEIIMYRFGDTIFDSSAVKLICSKFSRHSFDIRIIIRFIADLLDQYIHTC